MECRETSTSSALASIKRKREDDGYTDCQAGPHDADLPLRRGELAKEEEAKMARGAAGAPLLPTSTTSSSAVTPVSFESIVQDVEQYRACRHAPLPDAVARTLQTKAEWGTATCTPTQRKSIEEAVQRKQSELDRTNQLYKALARKSFQLSITLLLPSQSLQPDPIPVRQQLPPASTTPVTSTCQTTSTCPTTPPADIHRTIVLPAAMPLVKLHKTLQAIMGWEDSLKYMFLTSDGVPIAKHHKDELPSLSDSRIRLAYIVKDSGDQFYYQYGPWAHRLIVETVGAPRRNIPSTRVISGLGLCPADDIAPESFVDTLQRNGGDTGTFSVDAVNAQLMAGQTFYMRIPASASKEHEELMCLRAMRTPVNILATPFAEGSGSGSGSAAGPSGSSSTVLSQPADAYSSPNSCGLPSVAPSPPSGPATPGATAASAKSLTSRPPPQPAASSSSSSSSSSSTSSWTSPPPQPQQQQQHRDSSYATALAHGHAPHHSGSLPNHYWPSALQQHDLALWRNEALEESGERHLSAPSFFPSSSSSSSSSTTTTTSSSSFSSFTSELEHGVLDAENHRFYGAMARYGDGSDGPSLLTQQSTWPASPNYDSLHPPQLHYSHNFNHQHQHHQQQQHQHHLPFPTQTLPPFSSSSLYAHDIYSTYGGGGGGGDRLPPLSGGAGLFSPDSSPPQPFFSPSWSSAATPTSSVSAPMPLPLYGHPSPPTATAASSGPVLPLPFSSSSSSSSSSRGDQAPSSWPPVMPSSSSPTALPFAAAAPSPSFPPAFLLGKPKSAPRSGGGDADRPGV